MLFDRARGKAAQPHTGEDGGPVRFIVATGVPEPDGPMDWDNRSSGVAQDGPLFKCGSNSEDAPPKLEPRPLPSTPPSYRPKPEPALEQPKLKYYDWQRS
jgi:hypothetical protein